MLWFLAFAMGENGGAEVSAGRKAVEPPLSPSFSVAEFVSGAVIKLSTALLLCHLKSLHSCVVTDLVQICKSKSFRKPRRLTDGFRVAEIIWSRGSKNCSVLLTM